MERTVKALSVPDTVHGGTSFNGMSPICKGSQNTYYLSALSAGETTLWRIEPIRQKKTAAFTIYSLTKSPAVTQTAMLYQQEHPELKVELWVGMEDDNGTYPYRCDQAVKYRADEWQWTGSDCDGWTFRRKIYGYGITASIGCDVSDDKYLF